MRCFYLYLLATIFTISFASLQIDYTESVKFSHAFNIKEFERFTFLQKLFYFLENVKLDRDCGFKFNEINGTMLFRNITFFDTADHILAKKQTQLRSSSNEILQENGKMFFSGIGVQVNNQLQQILIDILENIHLKTNNHASNEVHGNIEVKLEQNIHGWYVGSNNYFDLNIIMNNATFNTLDEIQIYYPSIKEDFDLGNDPMKPVKTIYQWLWTDIKMTFGKTNIDASLIFTYDHYKDKTPSTIDFTWSVVQNNGTWNDHNLKCSMDLLRKFDF